MPEPIPVLADLSDQEKEVVEAARRGVEVVCSDLDVEELATSDDPDHVVRAELIRELLLGRRGELDPRGVRIAGAHLTGELDLAHVRATTGLRLVHCAVPEKIYAREAELPFLDLTMSLMTTLSASRLHIMANLILVGVQIKCDQQESAVQLLSARIDGQINFTGALITSSQGPAVAADALHTNNMLFFRDTKITSDNEEGAVSLRAAHIGGQVAFQRASITNNRGPAINADSIRMEGNLLLSDTKIVGNGVKGAIRLVGSHIGGQVDLDGANLTNDDGPAVDADSMHTDSHLFARDIKITSKSHNGSFLLAGARIEGVASLTNANIVDSRGPAIQAQAARFNDILFVDSATVSGGGEGGVVDLSGTRIEGPLACQGLTATTDRGLKIDLREAVLNQQAHLEATLVCARPDSQGPCHQSGRISLDMFTYASLGRMTWKQWLHLIRFHTNEYRPQPYQQLAAVERAAGHDHNARHILIAQQQDLRRRNPEALGNRPAQWIHAIWGVLGGYGYRAARLGLALIIALTLSGTLGWVAGQVDTRPGHLAAERVTTQAAPAGTPCSFIELVGLGIDRGLPLGTTGLRSRCDLDTATRWGQGFTIAIWCIQIAVWALATLAIASYTGLIRKPA
ncbi:hypothetical protein FKR81_01110 [Lentzea tibetensis]|uniref:Membrane-associated oxidoreductase n=1 Tax=Lentzea tibetensis TaxID=2591470 RepID=A0A563F357_9PSEU|nr:hypothetical protein [Lentzea tibetensis]TWP54191.1 hypothetical protein FKR81_01110 [Lentzea tibetensis]